MGDRPSGGLALKSTLVASPWSRTVAASGNPGQIAVARARHLWGEESLRFLMGGNRGPNPHRRSAFLTSCAHPTDVAHPKSIALLGEYDMIAALHVITTPSTLRNSGSASTSGDDRLPRGARHQRTPQRLRGRSTAARSHFTDGPSRLQDRLDRGSSRISWGAATEPA
jgi:hypothetical protein